MGYTEKIEFLSKHIMVDDTCSQSRVFEEKINIPLLEERSTVISQISRIKVNFLIEKQSFRGERGELRKHFSKKRYGVNSYAVSCRF